MNILILSGSPRKGGNTNLLVEAFVKGASPRHHVEVVSVHDYKINPCIGCNSCFARVICFVPKKRQEIRFRDGKTLMKVFSPEKLIISYQ